MRVVPNLYPALGRQEVVVHSPRHARSVAELSSEELARVGDVWRARAAAARGEGFGYIHAFVNEGREAGASLAHSHSQLAWLERQPPIPAAERQQRGNCGVCEVVRAATRDGSRVVTEREGILLLCPEAGRLPYELLVAPVAHDPDPWGDRLGAALQLLGDGLNRLFSVEGPQPSNAWLHGPAFGADGHWHIEVLPRLAILAGLELGAGYFVNWLPAEEAAARLRGG